MPLVVRRLLAFIIDYLLILIYAGLLIGATLVITDPQPLHPVKAQLLGFFTLTLPVFLYSFLLEKGAKRATIGKRIMKLSVQYNNPIDIAQRNFLKYLPWEIAHTGVHWLIFYSWSELEMFGSLRTWHRFLPWYILLVFSGLRELKRFTIFLPVPAWFTEVNNYFRP